MTTIERTLPYDRDITTREATMDMKQTVSEIMETVEIPSWCHRLSRAVVSDEGATFEARTVDGDEIEIDLWRSAGGWQAQAMRDGWDAIDDVPVSESIGEGYGETAEEAFCQCLGAMEG